MFLCNFFIVFGKCNSQGLVIDVCVCVYFKLKHSKYLHFLKILFYLAFVKLHMKGLYSSVDIAYFRKCLNLENLTKIKCLTGTFGAFSVE